VFSVISVVNMNFRSLCYIVLALAIVTVARADEQWSLITADFKSETVSVKSIDDKGIELTANGRTVGWDEFLQLDRLGQARTTLPKLVLWLSSGDRLAGAPVGMTGESLNWKSPSLGEIAVPLKQVRAIQRANQPSPSNDSARTEDALVLSNGDNVHGIISDISASAITIQAASGDSTSVPIGAILVADFASPPGASTAPAAPKRSFRVSIADGTIVSTDAIALSGRELHLKSAGADRPVPLSSIAGIEQVNGPVVWVSALAPQESVQIPYFSDRIQPAQMGKTVRGEEIRVDDRVVAHLIGVHSYSKLVYHLEPGFKTFRTRFAIDGDQNWADVTVRVKLDDKTAFEKTHVTAGAISDVVSLDLGDAKTLTLEVDYGENYDVQDRLNWIEPALLRAGLKG
jgi:hypothetical protein